MEKEEIIASRWKTAILFLISLAFVAMSVAIPSEADEIYASMFAGAFFGLGSVVFGWQLIRPQRLSLSPTGFTVSGGLIRSPKPVLWRDVSPFFVVSLRRGGRMIGYNFMPGARRESTLVRMNRLVGAEAALPGGWPGSPEQMVERINAYRAKALAEVSMPSSGAVIAPQADPTNVA